jgi:hypothetical protein
VPGNGIPNGIIAHVTHVQAAAGIGEHGQAIVFFTALIFPGAKGLALLPFLLHGLFDVFGVVLWLHDTVSNYTARQAGLQSAALRLGSVP